MNSESVKIHPHTEVGEGSRSSRWGRGFTLPPGAAAKGGDEEKAVGGGEQDYRSKQTSGEGCARWRTTPAGGVLPGGYGHDQRRGVLASRQGHRHSKEVSSRPSLQLPFRARAASSPSYPSRARRQQRTHNRGSKIFRVTGRVVRLCAAWNRLGAAIAWSSA
jgi:hypothetical protein